MILHDQYNIVLPLFFAAASTRAMEPLAYAWHCTAPVAESAGGFVLGSATLFWWSLGVRIRESYIGIVHTASCSQISTDCTLCTAVLRMHGVFLLLFSEMRATITKHDRKVRDAERENAKKLVAHVQSVVYR